MRIILQVTETLESGLNTGIQRVVRRLVDEISVIAPERGLGVHLVTASRHDRSLAVEVSIPNLQGDFSESENKNAIFDNPIYIRSAAIWNALNRSGFKRILNSRPALRAAEATVAFIHRAQVHDNKIEPFDIIEGDVFLILDSFWGSLEGLNLAKSAAQKGATVAVLINDIFPITHPEYVDEHNIVRFKSLVPVALELADYLFIPSQVTLAEIATHFYKGVMPKKHLVVKYGANLGAFRGPSRANTQRIANSILMIGTVEPRKNHQQVFDWYLSNGRHNTQLTIIGKAGWLTKSLQNQMRMEAKVNPLFRWLDDASDEELIFEMERHEIGIMASFAEGLGLPVLEMASHGLKLVLSDIPIFREVAGSEASFFKLGSVEELAIAIDTARSQNRQGSTQLALWEDTAQEIIDFLEKQQSSTANKSSSKSK